MGTHDIDDKAKTFRTTIGQRATVHREQLGAESAALPNRMLIDVGLKMQEVDSQLQHYTYLGSAAVHVYAAPTIDSLVFASQTDALRLYKCPEELAAKAFDDLLARMKEAYGHRPGKLRSGF